MGLACSGLKPRNETKTQVSSTPEPDLPTFHYGSEAHQFDIPDPGYFNSTARPSPLRSYDGAPNLSRDNSLKVEPRDQSSYHEDKPHSGYVFPDYAFPRYITHDKRGTPSPLTYLYHGVKSEPKQPYRGTNVPQFGQWDETLKFTQSHERTIVPKFGDWGENGPKFTQSHERTIVPKFGDWGENYTPALQHVPKPHERNNVPKFGDPGKNDPWFRIMLNARRNKWQETPPPSTYLYD